MRATMVRVASILAVAALIFAAFGCTPTGSGEQLSGGAELVKAKCTMCHTIDRVNEVKQDQAAWEQTISRMRTKGAQLTDAEATEIAVYLASQK